VRIKRKEDSPMSKKKKQKQKWKLKKSTRKHLKKFLVDLIIAIAVTAINFLLAKFIG